MANTYSWEISSLETYVEKESLPYVVFNIHYRYKATDANGNEADIFGQQRVGDPDPESFTNFADITNDMVISWLESAINVEYLKESVDARLAEKVNPTKVTLYIGQDPNNPSGTGQEEVI